MQKAFTDRKFKLLKISFYFWKECLLGSYVALESGTRYKIYVT